MHAGRGEAPQVFLRCGEHHAERGHDVELEDGVGVGLRAAQFQWEAAIRALLCDLFDWPARPVPGYVLPFNYQLAHTSLTTLTRTQGRWTLLTYNDHAHLEES